MPDVMFTGPEGRLEGRYHQSKEEHAPIALILHPHPQYGGTMNHKVVFSLFHVFVNRGFSVLRFNTRGVGRSQGRFDNGRVIETAKRGDSGQAPVALHDGIERSGQDRRAI